MEKAANRVERERTREDGMEYDLNYCNHQLLHRCTQMPIITLLIFFLNASVAPGVQRGVGRRARRRRHARRAAPARRHGTRAPLVGVRHATRAGGRRASARRRRRLARRPAWTARERARRACTAGARPAERHRPAAARLLPHGGHARARRRRRRIHARPARRGEKSFFVAVLEAPCWRRRSMYTKGWIFMCFFLAYRSFAVNLR